MSDARSCTADSALRIGRALNIDPVFLVKLQASLDLIEASRKIGVAIKEIPVLTSGRTYGFDALPGDGR